MKTYQVHFSFYSEDCGCFDEAIYKVEAENQFEARRAAWTLLDHDDNMRLASCVRQIGVTWDASPLDLRDYLNALAAENKRELNVIDAIDIPNAKMKRDDAAKDRAQNQRTYLFGCMDTTRQFARDIGKPFGMEPPDVCEEIEYAWRLVGLLDTEGKHEQAQELADIIDRAKNWDGGAGYDLKDLFSKGYTLLCGETERFTKHFGRDGVYPVKEDVDENDYTYISRWLNAPAVKRLSGLPPFDGRHVISGGEDMAYNYRTLVLRQGVFGEGYEKAESLLWTPSEDADEIGFDYDGIFPAENCITAERQYFHRSDFCGILRPELESNIDLNALKQEYASAHESDNSNEDGWEMEGDDD